MHFIFRAVTQQSDRPVLREMLQKPQRELLAMVLNVPVTFIDRAAFAQLL